MFVNARSTAERDFTFFNYLSISFVEV